MRPLDAYGALAFLRAREDVIADRVGLLGWSNGASTTLVAMATDAPGIDEDEISKGAADVETDPISRSSSWASSVWSFGHGEPENASRPRIVARPRR